ncbi:hypothetical protein YC2023_093835 [Brassica napus]
MTTPSTNRDDSPTRRRTDKGGKGTRKTRTQIQILRQIQTTATTNDQRESSSTHLPLYYVCSTNWIPWEESEDRVRQRL